MPEEKKEIPKRKLQARNCFVCGSDNSRGLRIPFYYDGTSVRAEFVPNEDLCGFDGMVHGGIIFSLADEAMMHLIWASGMKAITAEITMRYHNYARTNREINLTADFEMVGKRLIKAKCEIYNDSGKKIATARGKFLPFSGDDEKVFKKRF